MTSRTHLMNHMEDMLAVIKDYQNRGLLESAEAVVNFLEGYVRGTREDFDQDTKRGLYGS